MQNRAEDLDACVTVGTAKSGNPIRMLRDYMDCDFRILTGFIEPQFFAGFSARDTWQARIHAKICQSAKVYFYSGPLTDEQIRGVFMEPC